LQLRGRRLAGEGVAQAGTDQFKVVLCIVVQLAFDRVADFFAEVDEPAIEILSTLEVVTAQRHIHQHLLEADRVGHRHEDDFAAQAAGGFKLRQALFEMPGDQHARQFVGMQRGLNVHLALGLLWAEVETVNLPCGPRQRGQQVMDLVAHFLLFISEAVASESARGRPASGVRRGGTGQPAQT
jgi:hypothetical protein